MYRIFLVEDDDSIAGSIIRHLEGWGFTAVRAQDYQNILSAFVACDPQLVLLDISLPFAGGYHWCEEIRRISKVPIIFISSAADNMNIVMAVSAGADDFIAKPFDLPVLTAKIQAVLRRAYAFAGQSPVAELDGLLVQVECVIERNALVVNGIDDLVEALLHAFKRDVRLTCHRIPLPTTSQCARARR